MTFSLDNRPSYDAEWCQLSGSVPCESLRSYDRHMTFSLDKLSRHMTISGRDLALRLPGGVDPGVGQPSADRHARQRQHGQPAKNSA